MFVIGGGELVAKTAGVPVRRYKIYAFAVSGMLAGVGAALAVARMGAAGPTLGNDLLLNSLAAIVVGGTSLSGGRGSVAGTVLGCLIIGVLNNGLFLLNVSPFWQQVIKGGVILLAVALDKMNAKGRET